MKKKLRVTLPTAVLWQFREFKRDEVPAPKISFVPSYSVDEVTEYIDAGGNMEPVELSIIGNTALLTDGNHRIVAAKRLGLKMMRVEIVVYFGQNNYPFYEHTLKRFKPVSKHLALWLKRIFLVQDFKSSKLTINTHEILENADFNQHPHLN